MEERKQRFESRKKGARRAGRQVWGRGQGDGGPTPREVLADEVVCSTATGGGQGPAKIGQAALRFAEGCAALRVRLMGMIDQEGIVIENRQEVETARARRYQPSA